MPARPSRKPLLAVRLPDGTTVEVYDPRPSTPPPAPTARVLRVVTTTGTDVSRGRAA